MHINGGVSACTLTVVLQSVLDWHSSGKNMSVLCRLPRTHRPHIGQAATATQAPHWAGCHGHTGPTLGRLSGIPCVYGTLLGGCVGYPVCMIPCFEGV